MSCLMINNGCIHHSIARTINCSSMRKRSQFTSRQQKGHPWGSVRLSWNDGRVKRGAWKLPHQTGHNLLVCNSKHNKHSAGSHLPMRSMTSTLSSSNAVITLLDGIIFSTAIPCVSYTPEQAATLLKTCSLYVHTWSAPQRGTQQHKRTYARITYPRPSWIALRAFAGILALAAHYLASPLFPCGPLHQCCCARGRQQK